MPSNQQCLDSVEKQVDNIYPIVQSSEEYKEVTQSDDFQLQSDVGLRFSEPGSATEDLNVLIKGYFEVKVVLGGFYDQVAIGLTTDQNFNQHSHVQEQFVGYTKGSIGLHADDGKCYINGEQSFAYSNSFSS